MKPFPSREKKNQSDLRFIIEMRGNRRNAKKQIKFSGAVSLPSLETIDAAVFSLLIRNDQMPRQAIGIVVARCFPGSAIAG